MGLPEPFLAGLRSLGLDRVSQDRAELQEYGRDWTRILEPDPSAVVFPGSTAQVADLLRLCSEYDVPVVPSGGRTGLAGGAVAAAGEVVLSLSRMRSMDPVDEVGMTVRVDAGAVTEAVHEHCRASGLFWPVDFASKGSSQVGGNLATNAGGVKVIRYGHTRQWVLGVRVVTMAGEVLELNGALEKNNTGLDLRQLFIGSEGTLGVITEARLKLCPLPPRCDVLLFSLSSLEDVLRLFRDVRRQPFVLSAFEFFTDRCMKRLLRHRKVHNPLAGSAGYYALVELEDPAESTLEQWLSEVLDGDCVVDGTLAQTQAQARELWSLREGISESLSATGFPHKNDIALPVHSLTDFCVEMNSLFAAEYPDWEICLFGHIGDGNLHVNIMKPDRMTTEDFMKHTHDADAAMFDLVRKYEGSVSAEHGIGLLKKPWLAHTRSAEEIELMRQVKRVLDPKGLLNPGKVLP